MGRLDKLAISQRAIAVLVPAIKLRGTHHPAQAAAPKHWELTLLDCLLIYTEMALLSPSDRALSCLLDVWSTVPSGKLLSVSWQPDRPWVPPDVSTFKRSELIPLLLDAAEALNSPGAK